MAPCPWCTLSLVTGRVFLIFVPVISERSRINYRTGTAATPTACDNLPPGCPASYRRVALSHARYTSSRPLPVPLAHMRLFPHLLWMVACQELRYIVIERGDAGFGVVCTSANVITALKGRAASDSLLRIGDLVVSVDGEELRGGERLSDRIRASPERTSFTLGAIDITPPPPPPSLPQMMRSMLANPGIRKAVTKMAVGMVTGGMGGDAVGQLLEGAPRQDLLGGGAESTVPDDKALALSAVQQQQQQLEAAMEQQLSAVLDSPAFGDMMERVIESPAVQRVVHQAEAGTLCPDADTPRALTACLLDIGLMSSMTDASCEAMGASKAECEQVHLQMSAMLDGLGLKGDSWMGIHIHSWMGWLVQRLLLRSWLASAMASALELLLALAVLLLGACFLRRSSWRCE